MTDPAPLLGALRDHLTELDDSGFGPETASAESLARLAELKVAPAPAAAPTAPVATPAPPPRPAATPPPASKPRPTAPRPAVPHTDGSNAERLDALRAHVLPCTLCAHLAASRKNVVFGTGNPEAELMFVGEAPGADEDARGEPFVGAAGELLTRMIGAMEFERPEVYIANVLKCRPDTPNATAGNRPPRPDEIATCRPYLEAQIDIIRPRVLVTLGNTATEALLPDTRTSETRGTWQEFRGIPLMPTYHPAYLLRNRALSERRKAWEHLLQVLELLGRPISARQRSFFLKQ